jgi:hypothetical protein
MPDEWNLREKRRDSKPIPLIDVDRVIANATTCSSPLTLLAICRLTGSQAARGREGKPFREEMPISLLDQALGKPH